MKFRLVSINTAQSLDSAPDTRTHNLSFDEVAGEAPDYADRIPGYSSTLQLSLTVAEFEAGDYALGGVYSLETPIPIATN